MYINHNENPIRNRVGDCTVRAISKVLGQTWEKTYAGMAAEGYRLCDMPSANSVWGAYLRSKGFERHIIPNTCPDDYTVEDFCADHPDGRYILALNSHVVAVINGDHYDTWDSGRECPIFFWKGKEKV